METIWARRNIASKCCVARRPGALPGQALVLLDPQRMVIDDVVPCEDGHAQERSLLDQVLAALKPRDLLIDDRNFCTLQFLFGMAARKVRYITRQHGRMPWKSLGKPRYVGVVETGRVYEEPVELRDPETGRTTQVRRIILRLKSPTRDDDNEIYLLTNLPTKVSATKVASLYRKRWTLEQAFQRADDLPSLRTEHARLPEGGVVCLLRGNLLLQPAGCGQRNAAPEVHGEEKVEEVSKLLPDERNQFRIRRNDGCHSHSEMGVSAKPHSASTSGPAIGLGPTR